MFVTVKYGADEEKIVNPNCLSAVLLGHIRKTCGFEGIPEHLDLASESGEVMDLSSKGKEYAKKYLEPRTNYIIVKIIGDETEDSTPTYIPLLDNAAEKIKFSITNPNRRANKQQKGEKASSLEKSGAGGEGGQPTGKQGDAKSANQKKDANKNSSSADQGEGKAGKGGEGGDTKTPKAASSKAKK